MQRGNKTAIKQTFVLLQAECRDYEWFKYGLLSMAEKAVTCLGRYDLIS